MAVPKKRTSFSKKKIKLFLKTYKKFKSYKLCSNCNNKIYKYKCLNCFTPIKTIKY